MISTEAATPATHGDATNTHILVPSVRDEVEDSPAIVSNTRRGASMIFEDVYKKDRKVGIIPILPITEYPLKTT
jgi:hypothetical protein